MRTQDGERIAAAHAVVATNSPINKRLEVHQYGIALATARSSAPLNEAKEPSERKRRLG
jgi:hypothetical protein